MSALDGGRGRAGSAPRAESILSERAERWGSVAVLAGLCAGSRPLFLMELSGVLPSRCGVLSWRLGRGELSCA